MSAKLPADGTDNLKMTLLETTERDLTFAIPKLVPTPALAFHLQLWQIQFGCCQERLGSFDIQVIT